MESCAVVQRHSAPAEDDILDGFVPVAFSRGNAHHLRHLSRATPVVAPHGDLPERCRRDGAAGGPPFDVAPLKGPGPLPHESDDLDLRHHVLHPCPSLDQWLTSSGCSSCSTSRNPSKTTTPCAVVEVEVNVAAAAAARAVSYWEDVGVERDAVPDADDDDDDVYGSGSSGGDDIIGMTEDGEFLRRRDQRALTVHPDGAERLACRSGGRRWGAAARSPPSSGTGRRRHTRWATATPSSRSHPLARGPWDPCGDGRDDVMSPRCDCVLFASSNSSSDDDDEDDAAVVAAVRWETWGAGADRDPHHGEAPRGGGVRSAEEAEKRLRHLLLRRREKENDACHEAVWRVLHRDAVHEAAAAARRAWHRWEFERRPLWER